MAGLIALRPRHRETAIRHIHFRDIEYDLIVRDAQRIAERPIRRAQVLDRDAFPSVHAGGTPAASTSARRLALVGEQVEQRADVVRRDPGVRHVADEARLARRRDHDFRPLVPARGRRSREEEVEHLDAPARASPGARSAPTVRSSYGV